MTPPNPELQQRIQRIEYGLEQVGSLLVPVEISDGVKKAITLCNIDPEMALGRARKPTRKSNCCGSRCQRTTPTMLVDRSHP